MPQGIGYPGDKNGVVGNNDGNPGRMSDQIVANFQGLPPEEQEQLRRLNTSPDVQAYVSIMRKVLPPEVVEGLPGLRAPQRQGPAQRPQGTGLLSQLGQPIAN